MGRKCDTARRYDDIDWRRGDTEEGGGGGDIASWADANLTELKNEENSHSQSSCYK
jgi:hypothetical protein